MRVTLYTKPECHLCEPIKADLEVLRHEVGFDFVLQNIEEDVEIFEKFRYLIPVVDIADGPMFYAPIDHFALQQAILQQSAAADV